MRRGCSLVILAGGLSRRMGRDKAALPAGDGTLIEHLARRLAPVVDETIIAGGAGSPPLWGGPARARHLPRPRPPPGMLPGFSPPEKRPVSAGGWRPPACHPGPGQIPP